MLQESSASIKIYLQLIFFLTFLLNDLNSQNPNYLWAHCAGSVSNEWGSGIASDNSGNVYVTGSYRSSSITFGTITLTNSNSNAAELYLVKYDATGNVVWVRTANTSLDDYGDAVATDASGNIYLTGYFEGDSITFGNTTLINVNGSFDVYIVKYDSAGNLLWARSGGGTSNDYGHDIATDASNNVYVTGYFDSPSIIFGSTTLYNNGADDIFIIKYDPSGNILWAKNEGGANTDRANGLSTDLNGNVYVTGNFGSSSIIFGASTIFNSGSIDFFILKYDSVGNKIWARSGGGGGGDDYGYSVSADNNGNIYVTGEFDSPNITLGSTTLINSGNSDILMVKYDSNGNVIWAKNPGGNSVEAGRDVVNDVSGNIFFTGYFVSSSISFDSNNILTNADPTNTTNDLFIVKYDPLGNVLWVKGAVNLDYDYAESIAVDTIGDLYITGSFQSSPITFGSFTLPYAGSGDVFAAKLGNLSGFQENNSSNDLIIFPNPASDFVNVNISDKALATIYDLQGRAVLKQNLLEGKNEIGIEGLAEGIYEIIISTEDDVVIKKLVVKENE